MKTSQVIYTAVVSMCFIIGLSACSEEKIDPSCDGSDITYDNFIKSFVQSNCLGGSCHSSGSGNGDFTTFAKLQVVVNNGKFTSEVLVNQTMPQGSTLNQDELNKVQCWADAGFPEN